MQKQSSNRYRLTWRGFPQPLGSTSWHSVVMYVKHSLNSGAKLSDFAIFDQYGQIKTSLINDKSADPTLTVNYIKLF